MATPKTIIITNLPNAFNLESLPSSRLTASSEKMVSDIGYSEIDSPTTRKRQRLDHLSHEEKILRRKLKNRVAAQSARDRKKAHMQDLEGEVKILENKAKKLQEENLRLQMKNEELEKENAELKLKLGMQAISNVIKQEPNDSVEMPESGLNKSLEYAEGSGSVGGCSLDDALRWLADVEPDELVDVLQQLTEELDEDTATSNQGGDEEVNSSIKSSSTVVGTPATELESLKELIQFDHVYYKSNPSKPDQEMVIDSVVSHEGDIHSENELQIGSKISETNLDIAEYVTVEMVKSEQMEIDNQNSVLFPTPPHSDMNSSVNTQNSEMERLTADQDDNLGSLSDSGYETSSPLLSPFSDSGSCSSLWEDSFHELFPSLI